MADPTTVNMSSEELSNLTSALKDFNKILQKTNKDLLKSENSIENMSSHQKDMNKILPKMNKDVKSIATSVGEMVGSLTKGLSLTFLGGITGYSAKLVKDAIALDTITHQTAIRMGMGTEGIKKMKGAVNDLQKNFGAAYQDAAELVNELTERHYVENISEAAASINLMHRATGESTSSLIQFADNLSKAAGMSQKSISATMASMTKAQQAVGLSKAGMSAVVDTVQKAAEKMAAFGKTEAEIKKMATSTVLLASSMEKVGISAGRAADLVEQLTDPDRIEDNIMLYSQLGISMQDALEGNIDISQDQLKELGQKIADMGPIAGKQLAQSMGMSYTEAVKMSKLEAPEVDVGQVEVSEDGAIEALDEMTKKTEGIELKTKRFFNEVEGRIRKLGPVAIGIIGVILPTLLQKTVKTLREFFSSGEKEASVFTEAVGDAISTTVRKTGEEIGVVAKTGAKNFSEAFTATIAQHNLFNGFDKRAGAAFERAAKSIGKGFLDEFKNAGIDNLATVYEDQIKKITVENESWKKQIQDLNMELKLTENGLIDVAATQDAALAAGKELTTQQVDFLRMAAGAIAANSKEQEKINQKKMKTLGIDEKGMTILKEQQKYTEMKNALDEKAKSIQDDISKKQQEQVAALAEQQRLREMADKAGKEGNQAVKEALNRRATEQEMIVKQKAKEISISAEELRNSQTQLELQNQIVQAAQDGDEKRIKSTQELSKQIQENSDKRKKEIDSLDDATILLEKQKNIEGSIKNTVEDIGKIKPPKLIDEKELQKAKNIKGVIGSFTKGVSVRIKTHLENTEFMKSWRNSVREINKARMAKGKSQVGLARGAAIMAGKKAAGGTLKAIGGITKMLGPMAIVMALAGKFIDKIKEPLSNVVDNLMDSLQPVLDVIMPIVSNLMNVLVKSLMPPILKILSMGLKVLNFILKPIIGILRLCEHIPGIGGALKGTADALEAATGPEVQKALVEAADNIGSSTKDFTKAVSEEKEENKPTQLRVEGGQAVVSQKGSTTTETASSQVSSTTQTVVEKKTADDSVKEQEKAKDRKDSKKVRDFLTGTSTKDLPTFFNELITAVNNLTAQISQSNTLTAAPQKIGNSTGVPDTDIADA